MVVEPTHLKNMLVKLGIISPKFFRGENKKTFETTTWLFDDNASIYPPWN